YRVLSIQIGPAPLLIGSIERLAARLFMVTVRLWAVTGHARAIWAEPSVCTDMPGSLWAVPLPREQPCRLKSLSKQFLVSGDIPNFTAGCSLSGYRRSARRLMGPEMREEVLQQAIRQITELVLLHGGPVTGSTAFIDAGRRLDEKEPLPKPPKESIYTGLQDERAVITGFTVEPRDSNKT
uniref:Uncharacterized protein n=1 Tax=Oryza glaberrima TaxID=4538 RepID=I1PMV7_ORYGL